MKPLFIFSLPRSGSTLLQRILGAHPDIATTSEPWLLLPALSVFRKGDVVSRYCHTNLSSAHQDFCACLPNGERDYKAALAGFANELYLKAAGRDDARYFLDKTPRYHLFAEDIFEMFPEAKFVFLWRNPLSIISSIVETWCQGRWNLHGNYVDLFDGLDSLLAAQQRGHARSISICYEDLVLDPQKTVKRLCDYLELDFREEQLQEFTKINLKGRLGDSVGVKKYAELNDQSIMAWQRSLNSGVRKRWCRKYLEQNQRMSQVGYDVDDLKAQLDMLSTSWKQEAVDLVQIPFFAILNFFGKHYFSKKITEARVHRRIYRWS